jgi:hypothetical protein
VQGEPATAVTVTASAEPAETRFTDEPPFTEEPAPTEEPSPEEDSGPATFGQICTWEDGLEATVTKAERGTVSSEDIAKPWS